MKKLFFLIIAVALANFCYAKETTVFYEEFEDGDWINNPEWQLIGGRAYILDGRLHHDGVIRDYSSRYWSIFDSFVNFSTTNKIVFSVSGNLKSEGNPQEGKVVHLALINNYGRYEIKITNGIAENSITLGYGSQYGQGIYIKTSFVPSRDTWYHVVGIRDNGIWSLYVNGELIGQHPDTMGYDEFSQVHMPLVGSVIVDNISIIVEDKEEEINPLLLKYSPVFYIHWDEKYEPRPIESMLENSALVNSGNIEKFPPLGIRDISSLENSEEYSLDLTNADINLGEMPPPEDFLSYEPKVYGRVIDDGNYTNLQYFLFYPFQDWFTSHEGDWEMVQVSLNKDNRIDSVSYFFEIFKIAVYDTDQLDFQARTHPVVYVGRGSHNNYPAKKPIVLPESFLYFGNLLTSFMYLEELEYGRVLKPEVLTADDEYESIYYLQEITNLPSWVNYEGRWGQKTNLPFSSGQMFPKYNPRFKEYWRYPGRYSYSPNIPFISIFVYSPVDMLIFDESNEIVPWESDKVLFFTGHEHEPEAAILTGLNNCTIRLNAKEVGTFTMEVYYYNEEADSGIMLRYVNVTVTENTVASLFVGNSSYFVLCVNDNGGGECERFILPVEYVSYNGYTYSLPDKDGDGFNDYDDNCPEIFNDQADFNNNGRGDACDNPQYYKEKALVLAESFQAQTNKESAKKKIIMHNIRESLNPTYWNDEFTVITQKIFINEMWAAEFSTEEIADMLSLADSLIVEKLMQNISMEDNKRFSLAERFYELGNQQRSIGMHKKAILSYMKSWILLQPQQI